jgi:phage baseplate assembly protein V
MADRDLNKLWGKVTTYFRRGRLSRVDSSQACQLVSVSLNKDDDQDQVEHIEPYGFTSRAKDGAEAYTLNVGADGSHPIAICVGDRRFRLKDLGEGEVALYCEGGVSVVLKPSGEITLEASKINLGEGATEAVVLGDKLSTWLTSTLSVSTAMGPSGPALAGLVTGELSSIVKSK